MTVESAPYRVELEVRFREVDAYGIVWHGHFLDWLEVARHRFAAHFGFDTMAALERGHRLPMLEVRVEYRAPACCGDRIEVEIELADDPRKVVAFSYHVRRARDRKLLAVAHTVQVVQGTDGTLLIGWPPEVTALVEAMRSYGARRAGDTAVTTTGSETQ